MSFPGSDQHPRAHSTYKRVFGGGLYPALYMGSPPETGSDIAEMHSLASYEILALAQESKALHSLQELAWTS